MKNIFFALVMVLLMFTSCSTTRFYGIDAERESGSYYTEPLLGSYSYYCTPRYSDLASKVVVEKYCLVNSREGIFLLENNKLIKKIAHGNANQACSLDLRRERKLTITPTKEGYTYVRITKAGIIEEVKM